MEEKVMKVCRKCGRELPIDAFNKCAKHKDGHQRHCRECHSLYMKENYERKKSELVSATKTTAKISASMHKVYANPELAKFTPRQLMEELKARGFTWTVMYEPRREIKFEKI